MSRYLHIVSFDIPYPANYGGAMDVFYKIRTLHESGIRIILHCYYKGSLHHEPALESLCHRVYYYPRRTTLWQNFSRLPYTVVSRPTEPLLTDLLQDDYPILFEGLVCCQLLTHPALRTRARFFRECNIEHDYYRALGKASQSLWKKMFFSIEARKLQRYELKHLLSVNAIFAVAHQDEAHFRQMFPTTPVVYIPSFHPENIPAYPTDRGKYILYHGNLSVAENHKAAVHIITHIAPQLPDLSFVIAGLHPSKPLQTIAAGQPNVRLIDSPSDEEMQTLIAEAQIHLLITFQGTGLKLKLLNVLYTGRHIVVNPPMVVGTELSGLCHIGQNTAQLAALCRQYFGKPFTEEESLQRQALLQSTFANRHLVETLIEQIYH